MPEAAQPTYLSAHPTGHLYRYNAVNPHHIFYHTRDGRSTAKSNQYSRGYVLTAYCCHLGRFGDVDIVRYGLLQQNLLLLRSRMLLRGGVERHAAQPGQCVAVNRQRARKSLCTPSGIAGAKRLHQLLAHANTQR